MDGRVARTDDRAAGGGEVAGTANMYANRAGPGAHVASGSFMVGFSIVGTVPEAFEHPEQGLVGLHVMYLKFR